MNDIGHIMSLLDWNRNMSDQDLGVKLASKINDIRAFLQPGYPYGKRVWEGCARILADRSDEELAPYLCELLEWLEDLNWPGCFVIINRLIHFNADYLVDCFLNAINVAQKRPDDDKEWYNILSVLIENKKLASLLDDNVFRDLKNKYNEYWSCRGRNNI